MMAGSGTPRVPVVQLAQLVMVASVWVLGGGLVGLVGMGVMRWRGLSWSWGVPLLLGGPLMAVIGWQPMLGYGAALFVVVGGGGFWHARDLLAGGDLARRARDRRAPSDWVRGRLVRRKVRDDGWVTDEGTVVGIDPRGSLLRIPICGALPANGLVLGATGSGKTTLFRLMARAGIRRGFAVIVIDPKGDDDLLEELREAADRAGRRFSRWTDHGESVYNPYERGSDTEIADKLLAAEVFTEPHYQRLAQRYLGHLVRAVRAAGMTITLARIVEYMQPARLAALTRDLPEPVAAKLLEYLEDLTPQQERDLAGARDRLAIIAESDAGRWLDPQTPGEAIDLRTALEQGDVILFPLDADRLPLAAPMVAGAIMQDLAAICAARQSGTHRPGLLIFDELSAIVVGALAVARLSAAAAERGSAASWALRRPPTSSRCGSRAQRSASSSRWRGTSRRWSRFARTCPSPPRWSRRSPEPAAPGSLRTHRRRNGRASHGAWQPHTRTGVCDSLRRDQESRCGRRSGDRSSAPACKDRACPPPGSRREQGASVLTARDRELVRWIGRHGVAHTEHVMTRFSIGRTVAYRRVHELVEYDLLCRQCVLYADGGLLVVTADGLRWAGLDRLKPPRVALALVPHMLISTALAAQLEPQLVDHRLLSDREHRTAERAIGRPLGSAIIGSRQTARGALHRPDFVLVGRGDGVIAIEVELTLKERARLERILRGYVRNRNVHAIRYYAPPHIAEAVQRAAGAERLLEIAPLPVACIPQRGARARSDGRWT